MLWYDEIGVEASPTRPQPDEPGPARPVQQRIRDVYFRLENEKAAIQIQHEVVLNRIREMQTITGIYHKIEYNRLGGNYLEIYDHESLNDINDALYEYCEKTSITDAPDAFVELLWYISTRHLCNTKHRPVSVIHIGYVRLSIEEDESLYRAPLYIGQKKNFLMNGT